MKVLFIASTDDRLGGAKSLLELVTLLKAHGIEIIVVNPFPNKLNAELTEIGIENYSVGYHLNICQRNCSGIPFLIKYILKYTRYAVRQMIGIYNLEKFIDFSTIDIIHINNSVEDVGVYFSKKYHIPLIWHLREFGDLDFNFVYFHKSIGEYISRNSDRVIAISEAVRTEWVKKGVQESKIKTIVHGVNPHGIQFLHEENKRIQMVFTGAIVPQKGQFEFIKAISELEENEKRLIHLDLFGSCDDTYREEIELYIHENHLENTVTFKGYSGNLKELLHNYDVGIVNSRCEAMGRVTIEYMMAGLCVLASNRGANGELLNDGEYGYLFSYGEKKSIIESIRKVIKNRDNLGQIGSSARKRALEKYSIRKNYAEYILLYDSLIENKY